MEQTKEVCETAQVREIRE